MANKKPIEVDYCKEAMEMYLKELAPRDIDIIVYNISKVINGELNDIDLVLNKVDEKTKEIIKIKVPVKSFLRCESIKDSLEKLGVSRTKVSKYLEPLENVNKPKVVDNKPTSIFEVKGIIYNALKEKYGDAVISKRYDKDIVIDTLSEGKSKVSIKLEVL